MIKSSCDDPIADAKLALVIFHRAVVVGVAVGVTVGVVVGVIDVAVRFPLDSGCLWFSRGKSASSPRYGIIAVVAGVVCW
ncbi:hypothetical protein C2G38_2175372 [Gigaspora rosea]|uniref:Uncharacterized protein n=1 Tax=Gigaspora rosea TaxID=44941 RepID=A0A397VIR9_9GLOM|nr:hypothetical protein C2G38_2175372 [Gigaspora rosea]